MKCVKGSLILYQRSGRFTLYTFHEKGRSENEFDNFLTYYDNDKNVEEIDAILSALNEFSKRGVNWRRFRPKGEGRIEALLAGPYNLRLYVIPLGNDSIIVGNGCFKDKRTLQEAPECTKAWNLLMALEKELMERISNEEIRWEICQDGNGNYMGLNGDMYFEIGEC